MTNFIQLQKNIEKYGVEAAMSWASQFPDTISEPLCDAFSWEDSNEGLNYWHSINNCWTPPKPTPKVSTPKVLAFEEELQRRLDARNKVNSANKAIHQKALELAEASRKKLEKKLKKLIADSMGVNPSVEVE